MRSKASVIKELESLGIGYVVGSMDSILFSLDTTTTLNMKFRHGSFYYWGRDDDPNYVGEWIKTTTKDIPTMLVLYK